MFWRALIQFEDGIAIFTSHSHVPTAGSDPNVTGYEGLSRYSFMYVQM